MMVATVTDSVSLTVEGTFLMYVVSCDDSCLTCTEMGATHCTECPANHFLYFGVCLRACPAGYFGKDKNCEGINDFIY